MLRKYLKQIEKSEIIKICIFFTINLLSINYVEARWAKYEDVAYEREFYNKQLTINADGTNEEIVETQIKILKEAGRELAANYTLYYNEGNSALTILDAKTINDNKEYKIAANAIEDKPLASSPTGFDQHRQIMISFPNALIGSKIYIKYKQQYLKSPLDNYFGAAFYFGAGEYWRNSKVIISSKLPLYFAINDPNKALKVVSKQKDGLQTINIALRKQLVHKLAHEPTRNNFLDTKYLTWIEFSSVEKWEQLAHKLIPGYMRILAQPLPKDWQDIVTKAASQQSDEEKINTVTSLLNEKIRYMGDWRTVQGRYFPRDLAQIADSQLADCKDFTIATAAILQKLGYIVNPSLISRGISSASTEPIPSLGSFNHAFLKVTNNAGRVFWIDPTNFSSMAQGIYSDIADKNVLVLDETNPKYEHTPSIQPQDSTISIEEELELYGSDISHIGQFTVTGERAATFTGIGLYLSPTQIRDGFFHRLSGTYLDEKDINKLILPNLTSRIVKDFSAQYSYNHKNSALKTNLGIGIGMDYPWANLIINVSPAQIQDLLIGPPQTLHHKRTIKNTTVKQYQVLDVSITSPWLDITRKCSVNEDHTILNDIIVFKKTFITSKELETTEFKRLKDLVEQNLKNAILVTDIPLSNR